MATQVIEFDPKRPLDYEAVRKAFFAKGAADGDGHGRLESAFFHAIAAVHRHGMAQGGAAAAACVAIFNQLDESEIEAYPPAVQRAWSAGHDITHEGS